MAWIHVELDELWLLLLLEEDDDTEEEEAELTELTLDLELEDGPLCELVDRFRVVELDEVPRELVVILWVVDVRLSRVLLDSDSAYPAYHQ